MVVRDILACAQPNCHKTITALGTPTVECPRGGNVRKYATAEGCAAKKQKTTVRHFGYAFDVTRPRDQADRHIEWQKVYRSDCECVFTFVS